MATNTKTLLHDIDYGSMYCRLMALDKLARSWDDLTFAVIFESMKSDRDSRVRRHAAGLIGEHADAKAIEDLAAFLRNAAKPTVGDYQPLSSTSDPTASPRALAVQAIGRIAQRANCVDTRDVLSLLLFLNDSPRADSPTREIYRQTLDAVRRAAINVTLPIASEASKMLPEGLPLTARREPTKTTDNLPTPSGAAEPDYAPTPPASWRRILHPRP